MPPPSLRTRVLPVALLAATACGSDPPTIEVQLTLGHEAEAMRIDPKVTRVVVEARDQDGEVLASGSAAPGGAIELGELASADLVTFEARGTDASGATVLRGRSLGVLAGGLDGDVLPLFAQRTGAFARPPGTLPRAHVEGVGGVIAERWLLSTGGSVAIDEDGSDASPATADFYDLLALGGATGSSLLPRAARSIVTRGSAVLLIDDFGASWFDFDSGATSEAAAPDGLSFGLIAGGATVEGPDGVTFVVGPARSPSGSGSVATRNILRVSAAGTLSAASLNVSRAGACAAWVDGVGLVVAGGSGGVEVLGQDEELARVLPFPADPTAGAALVAVGDGTVMRLGGEGSNGPAPTAFFALGCATDCVADELPAELSLPAVTAVTHVQAFSTGDGVLSVGQDEDGATRAFLVPLDRTAPTELPLREPRRGATAVAAPNGTLALLGGQHLDGTPAMTVELFFP